jgi:predicted site-specific integrase-resolvase
MAQQRQLHGKAQTIGNAAAARHKILIGSGKGVMPRQGVRITRHAKEQPALSGYARVSTSDQDVAGQTMRLTEAGAIKVFGDVRSGRTMERPGLEPPQPLSVVRVR